MSIQQSLISILITGTNEEARENRVNAILKHHTISLEDTTRLTPSGETNTIGIQEVRQCIRGLQLTPFNSPIKAGVIINVPAATLEAQQAMLKLIEEPPNRTLIILTAPNTNGILPTIVSRCRIINVDRKQTSLSPDTANKLGSEFDALMKSSLGERLEKAEALAKDKQAAIIWLQDLIAWMRQELLDRQTNRPNRTANQLIPIIKTFSRTHHTLMTTNTNARLLLENMLLNLPKST